MAARWVFGLQPLQYRWPYQPLFVTGDYQYLVPNDRLAFAPGGPDSLGYRQRGFGFYTSPEAVPASSTPLSDFLFGHERSRYPAAEVDRIACAEPDAILIYVLGGFVSLQERMAFHLAVAPRNATLAIVLDGYNDVTIPANSAVRPGDPWQLGLRFSPFYGDGFFWWLSAHSAILHTLMQNELEADVLAFRQRLERDDALFTRHAQSIAGLYTENMNELLTSCTGHKLACLVAIQPGRAMSAAYSGIARDDLLSRKRMVALYDTLKEAVAASPQHERFVDLTHLFDGTDKLALFKDSVHPGDEGQVLLGEALVAPTFAALATGLRSSRRSAASACADAEVWISPGGRKPLWAMDASREAQIRGRVAFHCPY
jgi:hypothetical protein